MLKEEFTWEELIILIVKVKLLILKKKDEFIGCEIGFLNYVRKKGLAFYFFLFFLVYK